MVTVTDAGAVRTLKQARSAKMLTVRDLATLAGCAPNTVHQVEVGLRRPRFDTIKRLSAALGVEPAEVAEFRRALMLEGDER